MKRLLPFVAAIWIAASLFAQEPAVPVFLLAGQSNMEGKAQNKLWDFQATGERTAAEFAHLRDGDRWAVRDDVFIQFLNRRGPLTLGFGSRDRTGVELEFGTVMGEHFDQPVVLVKAAWGGHALAKQFRPPSSGMPSDEKLQQELEQAQARVAQRNEKHGGKDALPTMQDIRSVYGSSYRNMLAEVRRAFDPRDEAFPQLAGRRLELAGFVWFQGWNDQYGGLEKEYATHLRHLIEDLRRDLEAPGLPVVIGVMGQNGSKPAKGAMLAIQEAQLAAQEVPAFRGNVRAVRTDVFVDEAAESLYPTWKKNFEQWERTGSDYPYHYFGSALWHIRMGRAFADAMLAMR